ncbi:MAG TPA: hypothetical protein VN901_14550 [Candidatus Acidoferrales bacterium]|nr:hypothetical protein [Candidatus Acidoferrales bacterium]
MSGRKVESADIFAPEVHGNIMIESDDGQGIVRRRLSVHHVNVAGHFRDLELNFAEILVLSADQAAGRHTGSKEDPQFASVVSQLYFDFAHGLTF